MEKKNKCKLLGSAALVTISLALLVGLTFAWFTDSVKNTGNSITAGTLDIQLNDGNEEPLFSSDDLWEPGYSQKASATVSNTGSLWLKYSISAESLSMNIPEGKSDISRVLDVYKVNKSSNEVTVGDLTDGNKLGTVADLAAQGGMITGEAPLAPQGQSGTVDGENVDASDSFTIVVKMQESAGNEYQGVGISFDIVVKATQFTYEQDGFGSSQYDASAVYAATTSQEFKDALGSVEEDGTIVLGDDVTIEHTGKHPNGTYDTYITTQNVTIDLNGKTLTVVNNGYAFSLAANGITLKNGTIKVADEANTAYPLYVTSGAKDVVIDGVTIIGGMQVIGNSSVTLRNVDITATTYYDLYLEYNNTVTIESGTFTRSGNLAHIYTKRSTDEVIVQGGTFNGAQTPVSDGSGKCTIA